MNSLRPEPYALRLAFLAWAASDLALRPQCPDVRALRGQIDTIRAALAAEARQGMPS